MSVLAFKEHRGFCYEYVFASKGYKTHNSFQALGVLKQQKLNMTSFWELGLLPLLLNSQIPKYLLGFETRSHSQTHGDPYSTSWTAVIIGTNHHWLKLQFCYKPDESLGSYSSERPKQMIQEEKKKWAMVAKHGLLCDPRAAGKKNEAPEWSKQLFIFNWSFITKLNIKLKTTWTWYPDTGALPYLRFFSLKTRTRLSSYSKFPCKFST